MKISENVEKITNPGFKKLYRFYDRQKGRAIADLIALSDEVIPEDGEYVIFDENAVWKRKVLSDYKVKNLRVQLFKNGKCIYNLPSVDEIKDYCREQVNSLWDEICRFENPQTYYVDLSQKLWEMKQKLIKKHKG